MNYIPIVRLTDWLRCDGLDILVENEIKEQRGLLKNLLRQRNISEALPEAVSLQQIAETHFDLSEGNKAQKQTAAKFHEHVCMIDEFERIHASRDGDALYRWFSSSRSKKISEIIKRLSRHDVLGHYFLENLSNDGHDGQGFVCLLREINTLSKQVTEELGIGLTKSRYFELRDTDTFNSTLEISTDDLAMPIVEIASPTIEHILQCFTQLFGRIGVADPNEELVDSLIANCAPLELKEE